MTRRREGKKEGKKEGNKEGKKEGKKERKKETKKERKKERRKERRKTILRFQPRAVSNSGDPTANVMHRNTVALEALKNTW